MISKFFNTESVFLVDKCRRKIFLLSLPKLDSIFYEGSVWSKLGIDYIKEIIISRNLE